MGFPIWNFNGMQIRVCDAGAFIGHKHHTPWCWWTIYPQNGTQTRRLFDQVDGLFRYPDPLAQFITLLCIECVFWPAGCCRMTEKQTYRIIYAIRIILSNRIPAARKNNAKNQFNSLRSKCFFTVRIHCRIRASNFHFYFSFTILFRSRSRARLQTFAAFWRA